MIIIPGETNYPPTQILRNIWLGNIADAEKLSVENPFAIEEVINVCGVDVTRNPVINYYMDCKFDDGHEVPSTMFWYAVNNGVRIYEEDKNLLIHCMAGRSRSPIILAAIFHAAKIMEFDAALEFIRRRRPVIRPHHKILVSVRQHLKLWPYDQGWTKA